MSEKEEICKVECSSTCMSQGEQSTLATRHDSIMAIQQYSTFLDTRVVTFSSQRHPE
jgi:hypothetical protein